MTSRTSSDAKPNARHARGRQLFMNPGPTNIPDRVLRAMDRATLDFLSEEFLAIQRAAHEGLKRILRTKQRLLMYPANGHGAWEASIANLFRPGEKVLVLESGYFSQNWGDLARDFGLEVETLPADWRRGVPVADLGKRLAADRKAEIAAVLVVHNETATGLVHPIAELRRAIDAARHPALYLVDTISSLASIDVRMDEWGVDVLVGGSQKGLMLPTGLSFTGISTKAIEHASRDGQPRHYWDWRQMMGREPQGMRGTTPVHMFFGLEASVAMIEEEGLDNVLARHARLGAATRAAIARWGREARSGVSVTIKGFSGPVEAIELLCADATRVSDSVSAVLLPDGHSAEAVRRTALERFNLSLGGGLGPLGGRVFRIGHMGDLNEPMLLGALATVELTLGLCGVPHRKGGVEAAIAALEPC
jgi:alanine-glyoxylate transaminase/serine-glyoxylate transaminase/serine-pyruvate transaminase